MLDSPAALRHLPQPHSLQALSQQSMFLGICVRPEAEIITHSGNDTHTLKLQSPSLFEVVSASLEYQYICYAGWLYKYIPCSLMIKMETNLASCGFPLETL